MNRIFPISTSCNPSRGLVIAGHSLIDLAHQWGTPLYLYDAATVRFQVDQLRDILAQQYPGEGMIAYAAKAYFSLGFARKLSSLGLGVDVVSQGELAAAIKGGFAPEKIHLHGNNKSEEEVKQGLELGLQSIVVDSMDELLFLDSIAANMKKTAKIWLRLSPGLTAHTHSYVQTAHSASKFGLPVQDGQAQTAIRIAMKSNRVNLTGLHVHLGSQIFEEEIYRQAVQVMVQTAEESGFIPLELSTGGGWGVPYTPQDNDADPLRWVKTIAVAVVDEFSRRGWSLPRLVLEPGRWLSARAGVALYKVGAVKVSSEGHYFVSIDGGLADNPRPALYGSRYCVYPAADPDAPLKINGSLVGKFCETGDRLITDVTLPEVQRGDIVAVPVSGAYQLSMASNYNLAPRPAVLWLEEGAIEVLQPREDLESGWWFSQAE